jgi:hypothetical protein
MAVAALVLSGCAPPIAASGEELQDDWPTRSIALPPEAKWCVHDLSLQPEATFSDLADFLARNELEVCEWSEPSRLIASIPQAQETCEKLFGWPLASDIPRAEGHEAMPASCGGGLGPRPTATQAAGTLSVCFSVQPAVEPRYNSSSGEAIAFGLRRLGVPVRFFDVADSSTTVWLDTKNYPWPDALDQSLKHVAQSFGVKAIRSACQ